MKNNKLLYVIAITFLIIFTLQIKVKAENKDYFGRNLTLKKEPKRIISLTPATTEILFELGLDNNLVGVTNDCNYPLKATKKTKLGKFGFIDLEKVISLKPDIIFATSDMNKQLDVLKNYKVPLIALKTSNIASILENITYIGSVTNTNNKAKNLVSKLNAKITELNKKHNTKKPKVFYCIWHDPLITTGDKSFVGDMLNIAGGENIASKLESSFAKYSVESLIAGNPQYIIIPKLTNSKINFSTIPWIQLEAVKNKKIIIVDDDKFLRPTPRAIYAIEELQKKLK
jgi:iron complex transport system substrate-binding protein